MKSSTAMILAIAATILAFMFVIGLGAMTIATRAFAHEAPSGWLYDQDCCNTNDCHELPVGAVTLTPSHYLVTVTPETHHNLKGTRTYEIPYTATGIRPSGDEKYHLCVRNEYVNNAGEIFGGGVICFYVPPMGF